MNELSTSLIQASLTLIIGILITIISKNLISRLLKKLASKTNNITDDYIVNILLKAIRPIGLILSAYLSFSTLPFEGSIDSFFEAIFKLIIIVIIINLLEKITIRLIDDSSKNISDKAIISIVKSVNPLVKASIWAIGIIFYLQNMGVQMAAIWALLSAGGIGAGLALKEPVQEFFEYIIILLDKPFQNGEFINIENVWATVERVGVRSTRLRSLNGEAIVMSNSALTNGVISNYAKMKRRRLTHKLGVVYDTDISNIIAIPKIIESIIESIEDVKFDRCHFVGFGNFSLDFELVYYIPTNDYLRAMKAQQNINIGIMKKFKEHQIEFAFPTQTLNISKPVSDNINSIEPE